MAHIHASIGVSTKKDPIQAGQEAVQGAKLKFQKDKVDLALVVSSVDLSSVNLLKSISAYLISTPIIGCSSTAIISSEGIQKHAVMVVLLKFSEGIYFSSACVEGINLKTPSEAGQELAEKLLYGFRDIRRDLSLVLSDGSIKNGSSLIYGLQQKLGSSFPLVGASASANLRMAKTYLYFNQNLLNDAACGFLLGGKLNFGLGVKHGWQPLGKPRRVTKSEGNLVYEIDGEVASKLYEEYFAYSLSELNKELKRISVFYPIGIYLAGEEEYLLRNILAIQKDGSLLFQGDVPENSEIRLMIGTKESCLQATQEALNEAKAGLAGHTIDLAIVFDSVSRLILLGRQAHKELDIIRKGLGPATPIVGFYTYGEQAPLTSINYRGKAYFHNQTITVLTLGA